MSCLQVVCALSLFAMFFFGEIHDQTFVLFLVLAVGTFHRIGRTVVLQLVVTVGHDDNDFSSR